MTRIVETTTTVLHNLSEGISFDLLNVNLHLRFFQINFRGWFRVFESDPLVCYSTDLFSMRSSEKVRDSILSHPNSRFRSRVREGVLFSHLRAAPTLIPWTSMLSNSPVIQRMIMLLLSIQKVICECQTCQLFQGQSSDWLAVWSLAIWPEPKKPFRRRLVNDKLTNCVKDRVASKQLAKCVAPHLKILYTTYFLFFFVTFSPKQCRFRDVFQKVLLLKLFCCSPSWNTLFTHSESECGKVCILYVLNLS